MKSFFGIVAAITAIIAFFAYIGTAVFSDNWNPTPHKSTAKEGPLAVCVWTFWICLAIAILFGLICLIMK